MTLLEVVDRQTEIIKELCDIVDEQFRMLCLLCPPDAPEALALLERMERTAKEARALAGD